MTNNFIWDEDTSFGIPLYYGDYEFMNPKVTTTYRVLKNVNGFYYINRTITLSEDGHTKILSNDTDSWITGRIDTNIFTYDRFDMEIGDYVKAIILSEIYKTETNEAIKLKIIAYLLSSKKV